MPPNIIRMNARNVHEANLQYTHGSTSLRAYEMVEWSTQAPIPTCPQCQVKIQYQKTTMNTSGIAVTTPRRPHPVNIWPLLGRAQTAPHTNLRQCKCSVQYVPHILEYDGRLFFTVCLSADCHPVMNTATSSYSLLANDAEKYLSHTLLVKPVVQ